MEKKIKYLLRILAIGGIIIVIVGLAVVLLPNFVIKTQQKLNINKPAEVEKLEFASSSGLMANFSKINDFSFSTSTEQAVLKKDGKNVILRWVNRQQAEDFAKQEIVYTRQLENSGLVRNDYELAKPLETNLNLASVIWSGDQALLVLYNRDSLTETEKLLEEIQISAMPVAVSSSTATSTNKIIKTPTLVKSDGYIVNLFFPKKDSTDCQLFGSISIRVKDVDTELGLIPSVVKIVMQYPAAELDKLGFKPLIRENVRLLSYGYNYNNATLNFNELMRANDACPVSAIKKGLTQSLSSLQTSSSLQIRSVDIQIDGQKLK